MSAPLPAFRRIVLARRWLARDAAGAAAAFHGPEGPAVLAALDAPPLRWPDAPEVLKAAISKLRHAARPEDRAAPLLAGLLLTEPYRLPPLDPISGLPVWLGPALFRTLARGPDFFREAGDPNRWAHWAESLLAAIETAPPVRQPDGFALLEGLRLHAAFAGTGDLRGLMARRGTLIARFARTEDWTPPARGGGPIRLGHHAYHVKAVDQRAQRGHCEVWRSHEYDSGHRASVLCFGSRPVRADALRCAQG